jgi:hypothetical protein
MKNWIDRNQDVRIGVGGTAVWISAIAFAVIAVAAVAIWMLTVCCTAPVAH